MVRRRRDRRPMRRDPHAGQQPAARVQKRTPGVAVLIAAGWIHVLPLLIAGFHCASRTDRYDRPRGKPTPEWSWSVGFSSSSSCRDPALGTIGASRIIARMHDLGA